MHINNNIFSIFLGRWYGDRALGYYNQANKWTGIGYSTLTGMVWNVTQPVFARIADDRQQMQRAFRKMLRFTAFLACPCMFGLALIAPEFITIAITEKWLPSAQLMQILCIGGAFVPVASLYANFLVSQGKSNVYMYNTIGLCLVQLLLLYVLYPYGIRTMVVAYVVLNLLWLPVWHTFTARLIGVSFFRAVTDVAPFVLIAALAMGGAWWAAAFVENIVAALLIKIAVAAVLYVGMMKLCRAVILEECLDFLLRRTKKQ
jgi:O-antigen/teichoic acid export membrane protein